MKRRVENGSFNVHKMKGLSILDYDCDIIILKMKYNVGKITLKKGAQENTKFI